MKARVENFIIATAGTTAAPNGTRLYDFATDNLNLAVGAFGVYTGVANSGNPVAITAPTVSNADYIQFIQRRDTSNDTTPLYTRTLERSPEMKADCFMRVKATTASVKNNHAWLVGDVVANVGAVPVLDETEYIINSGMRGWNVDLFNGKNTPFKMGRFTTPDYSASTIYTTTAQQRDHLLQNVAFDFNLQTSTQVIAICLDSAATVTPVVPPALNPNYVYDITAVSGFSVGDNLIIGFDNNGQPIKLVLDRDLIQTFTELDTAGYGAYQVIPYALPTAANTAVTGRLIAGGTAAATPDAEVTHLLFLSLDLKRAAYDEKPQGKDRIQIGVDGGFGTTTASASVVEPNEGSGYAKDVLQYYRDTHGHSKYLGNKPWQNYFVEFPSGLVEGGIYDIIVVDSCNNRFATNGLPSVSPERTIIAILNTTTVGFTGYTGVANPQYAYVQTALNSWMNSTTYPHTNI